MTKRYGKARVPDCRCEYGYTCGPCLRNAPVYYFTPNKEREREQEARHPVHYAMTYEEVRATGRFTDKEDFDNHPNPICRNGSFYALETRDKSEVTCPLCRAKMGE